MSFRSNILIQLGVLSVIVDLDSAVASVPSLSTVCEGPLGGTPHILTAIKQETKCPDCGNEDKATMKKAKKVGKQFIPIDAEEVAQAKADSIGQTAAAIHLLVHPAEEVHLQTVHSGGAYAVKASNQGMVEAVGLLTRHIKEHPELAFTTLFAPSGRVNFYELVVFGDTLVLEQRCRTEDMKIVQQPLADENRVNLAMLDQFLPTLVAAYDVSLYQDQYLQKLETILASKVAVDGVQSVAAKSTGPKLVGAVDLSSMLSAGLAAAGLKAAA